MKNIVLMIDNDEDFLDTRSEDLENAGFRVLKAHTLDEARQMLCNAHFHVALFDIRMRDDLDAKDVSGLTLAKEPAYAHISKIILTDYPLFDTTREAMRPGSTGIAPAVDYLYKEEGPDAMIRAVEKALSSQPARSREIRFRWTLRQPLSPATVAHLLDPACPNEAFADRLEEMEDLFRNLFSACEQVTFNRLLWRKGENLAMDAWMLTGDQENPVVVLCAKREGSPLTPPLGAPIARAATCHFAASVWLNPAPLQTLEESLRERGEKSLRQTLETLLTAHIFPSAQGPVMDLLQACRTVYPLPMLKELLKQTAETARVSHRYHLADIDLAAEQMRVHFPSGRTWLLSHPFPDLEELTPELPCAWCEIPGGLDTSTILVSPNDTAWISENSGAGVFPEQHPYAAFETSLRETGWESANLQTLLETEQNLLKFKRLGEHHPLDDIEPEYRKTAALIQTVRRLVGKTTGEDPLPYLLVLYHLNLRAWLAPLPPGDWTCAETARQVHRLVSASLLIEAIQRFVQFGKPASAANLHPSPRPPLRIDGANHTVFKGETEIYLTGVEFDLLSYLFQHRGELCTRQDLKTNVFHLAPQDEDEGGLINTNIGRLRKKIDGDPECPPYLVTVRGVGYRLDKE